MALKIKDKAFGFNLSPLLLLTALLFSLFLFQDNNTKEKQKIFQTFKAPLKMFAMKTTCLYILMTFHAVRFCLQITLNKYYKARRVVEFLLFSTIQSFVLTRG